MTKRDAMLWIKKLNRHYGLKVHFRTGSAYGERYQPCADCRTNSILIPPHRAFYNPRIMAHEYAHLIQNREGLLNHHNPHDKTFTAIYNECCLVLGIFALQTGDLAAQVQEEFKVEKAIL